MKKLFVLVALTLLGLGVALFLYASGCNVTVLSPQYGETWVVGQTHNLGWFASNYCPDNFDKIELVGRSATAGDVTLETFYNVAKSPGSMPYTPTIQVVGYPSYLFKFWASEMAYLSPDFRTPSVAGTSPEFHIIKASPPLETDPPGFTLAGKQGEGTLLRDFYIVSNEGTIRWTASSNQPWLTSIPVQGTSTQNDLPIQGTLTVNLGGLSPGNYEGAITFTGAAREDVEAVLTVDLTVSTSSGGTPDLEVSPLRYHWTSHLGAEHTSKSCTLTNVGSGSGNWSAIESVPWITISPSSGQLGPGASVNCALSISENYERVGSHRGFVHFAAEGSEDESILVSLTLKPGAAPGTWSPTTQSTRTLPIVATGLGGADGSFWSSDIHAMAAGAAARTMQADRKLIALEHYIASGDPLRMNMSTLTAYREQLAAEADGLQRGTNRFIWGALQQKVRGFDSWNMDFDMDDFSSVMMLDVLGDYFEQEAASSFLQVRGTGVEDMLIASRTFTTDADGKTYGQFITTPEADEITRSAGGTVYVLGLINTEDFRSNIFVTEISGTPVDVTVKLYDENGSLTGNPLAETLQGYSQWQLTNIFYRTGSTALKGYAVVFSSGGGQISVLGSVIDRNTQDPTTIPGRVPGASYRAVEDLYLPAAVHAPGSKNTQWRSDFTILNTSTVTEEIQVDYVPEYGLANNVIPKTITLPGGAMAVYNDVLDSLFDLDVGKGSIFVRGVDSGSIFAFSRIYSELENGWTYGQGAMAYTLSDTISNGAGTLYLLGLERSPKFRSNVGILEVSGNGVEVFITVDPYNDEPRGFTKSIIPGQLLSLDDIIRDKAGFTDDVANVYVMIDVISGNGKVAAYGSIVDNDSSDATFIKGMKR